MSDDTKGLLTSRAFWVGGVLSTLVWVALAAALCGVL
jgi:hypothetical protein